MTTDPPTALFVDRGPCPLCGGDAFTPVHEFDQVPVRRCASPACGLLHAARVMTPAGTRRYYAEVFGSEFHRAGQEINAGVNDLVLGRLLDPARDGVRRVLDVGTGYGYLLRALARRGLEGVGVEVSAAESAFARERLGLDVRTGLLEEVDLPAGAFDLAACFEVIEHVPRPIEFVTQMARAVRPGGWVLIQTDNFASGAARGMGARFPKWIPHTHVCHFEPETLRRCLHLVPGLRVERQWSVTPLENAVRGWLGRRRGWPASRAADVWRLEPHLAREMRRGYPLAGLRRALALAWTRLTARPDSAGSLMFMLARKAG